MCAERCGDVFADLSRPGASDNTCALVSGVLNPG